MDAGVPQAESAEMKSPKRKVTRGESEETQDHVCEMPSISLEDGRSLRFCRVPLASRVGFVVHLPALQVFHWRTLFGGYRRQGLHAVGIDRKEALQLVVCNLWRKI